MGAVKNKHGTRADCGGTAMDNGVVEMLNCACATAGDHRDVHRPRDTSDQLKIITGHRPVPLDRRYQKLAGAHPFHMRGELRRLITSQARSTRCPDTVLA